MKLKESTFAIIAEKQDSISHKWFDEEVNNFAWNIGEYYLYNCGFKNWSRTLPKSYQHHIYTEAQFEALLKEEQENKQFKETMDRVIAPQVLEMAKFKEENPNATELEIEAKRNELVFKYATNPKNTAFGKENIAHKHVPLTEMPTWSKTVGFEEAKEITQESEILKKFDEYFANATEEELQKDWDLINSLDKKQISKVIKHRYSGAKSKKFWKIVNSIENEADRQEMYSLGVMLQRNEEYVLSQLRNLNIVAVV